MRGTGPTRRTVLGWAGSAAAGLGLPRGAAAAAPRRVTILMGSGGPLLAWAPSFVAEAMGYHREEGLELNRIYTRSGPAGMTALVSGSGEAYYSAPGEMLVAASRGQAFKVLMAQSAFHTLYFAVGKAYAARLGLTEDMPFEDKRRIAAAGFKGIRCAVSAPGSLTDGFARQVLAKLGLNPDTDARIVPTQSVENTVSAAANGTVDAFVGAPPTIHQAVGQIGAVLLFAVTRDEVPGFKAIGGHVVEARASEVARDPGLFEALIRAETRGLRHIVEAPAEASALLHETQYATSIAPDLWRVVWEKNISQFRSPYFAPSSLEAWVELGLVPGVGDPKAVGAAGIADMRFVDKAAAAIGWKVGS